MAAGGVCGGSRWPGRRQPAPRDPGRQPAVAVGRGGVCAWGRSRGKGAGRRGSRSPPGGMRPPPHSRGALLFPGRGPGGSAEGQGSRRPLRVSVSAEGTVVRSGLAARRAAAAGAPGYEWSWAGREPASGDSWGGGWILAGGGGGAECAVPLWRRKVDLTRGPAAGKPRCQVASG